MHCGSAEAAFVVVGKVAGVSNTGSNACDQYFKEGEQFFVYGSKSSTGECLLCLFGRLGRPHPYRLDQG